MERAASGTKWYKNTKINKDVHSCFSGNAFQGARFSTNNAAFITLSSCHNWQTDAIFIWTTLYWYSRYIIRQVFLIESLHESHMVLTSVVSIPLVRRTFAMLTLTGRFLFPLSCLLQTQHPYFSGETIVYMYTCQKTKR